MRVLQMLLAQKALAEMTGTFVMIFVGVKLEFTRFSGHLKKGILVIPSIPDAVRRGRVAKV